MSGTGGFDWVKGLKGELWACAVHLLTGRPLPTSEPAVALAALTSGRRGQVTANMALAAVVIAGVWVPERRVTLGPGFGGRIGRWGQEGETEEAATWAELALLDQLSPSGLHGGHECFGYWGFYLAIYTLAALSHDRSLKSFGARLLFGDLSVGRLLGGAEIGCRANGRTERNMADALELLRYTRDPGPAPHRWQILARNLFRLAWATGAIEPPPLEFPEQAVAVLRVSRVTCARRLQWVTWPDGRWAARLADPAPCERSGGYTPEINWPDSLSRIDPSWGVELGPEGLVSLGLGPEPSLAFGIVMDPGYEPIEDLDLSFDYLASGPGLYKRPHGPSGPTSPSRKPPPASDPVPEPPRSELEDLLDPLRADLRAEDLPRRGARGLADHILEQLEPLRGVPR